MPKHTRQFMDNVHQHVRTGFGMRKAMPARVAYMT